MLVCAIACTLLGSPLHAPYVVYPLHSLQLESPPRIIESPPRTIVTPVGVSGRRGGWMHQDSRGERHSEAAAAAGALIERDGVSTSGSRCRALVSMMHAGQNLPPTAWLEARGIGHLPAFCSDSDLLTRASLQPYCSGTTMGLRKALQMLQVVSVCGSACTAQVRSTTELVGSRAC